MAFMIAVTAVAMVLDLQRYMAGGQMLLTFVALSILVLSIWLVVEAFLRFRKDTVTLGSNMTGSPVDGD
jgi:hypothetical protein